MVQLRPWGVWDLREISGLAHRSRNVMFSNTLNEFFLYKRLRNGIFPSPWHSSWVGPPWTTGERRAGPQARCSWSHSEWMRCFGALQEAHPDFLAVTTPPQAASEIMERANGGVSKTVTKSGISHIDSIKCSSKEFNCIITILHHHTSLSALMEWACGCWSWRRRGRSPMGWRPNFPCLMKFGRINSYCVHISLFILSSLTWF